MSGHPSSSNISIILSRCTTERFEDDDKEYHTNARPCKAATGSDVPLLGEEACRGVNYDESQQQ